MAEAWLRVAALTDLAGKPVERDPPVAELRRQRGVVGKVGERGDALPAVGLLHRR